MSVHTGQLKKRCPSEPTTKTHHHCTALFPVRYQFGKRNKENPLSFEVCKSVVGKLTKSALVLRSRSKVASFLCDLQRTLQILVEEFTPVGNMIVRNLICNLKLPDSNFSTADWKALSPDWHFQGIKRVLEGEI